MKKKTLQMMRLLNRSRPEKGLSSRLQLKSLPSSLLLVGLFLLQACTVNSTEKAYNLAEKLWQNGNYAAAAKEFEKVYRESSDDPKGIEALYRAAMTETLFLDRHRDAVEKLNEYIERAPFENRWKAREEIGEIYYSRLHDYSQAFEFYGRICEELDKEPNEALSIGACRFRQAKALFFLRRFKEAEEKFLEIEKNYPDTEWSEKAHFERGYTLYNGAEQLEDPGESTKEYRRAIKVFEDFLKAYPKSAEISEAKFGIGLCYEELEQVDQALKVFEGLKDSYPSPEVVQIKLEKLKTRMQRQQRSL